MWEDQYKRPAANSAATCWEFMHVLAAQNGYRARTVYCPPWLKCKSHLFCQVFWWHLLKQRLKGHWSSYPSVSMNPARRSFTDPPFLVYATGVSCWSFGLRKSAWSMSCSALFPMWLCCIMTYILVCFVFGNHAAKWAQGAKHLWKAALEDCKSVQPFLLSVCPA